MDNAKTISIVLPVYQEEEGIAFFHEQLKQAIAQINGYKFEIIYVVDKGKDDTSSILKAICQEEEGVITLNLSRRFGHQASLVAGMDACTGEACIMMDCDMEHPPSLISELIQQYEEGYDIVHTKRAYSEKTNFLKTAFSNLFYWILNKLSEEDLGRSTADFRLISRTVIDIFSQKIREHNQYLRGLFHWVGFRQTEVEFLAGERARGKSKYTIKRLVRFASDGIVSFSKRPLQLSIFLGIAVSFLGIIYGIYSTITYFFFAALPAGWTTTIVLILVVGGTILLMQGITGLYIAGIFDEVKNRPLYIIETQYGASFNEGESKADHLK